MLDPPRVAAPTLDGMTTHTSNQTTDQTTDQSGNQLPSAVRAFTDAHAARDADAALALLTRDAVISDVGESFTGEGSLRRFVREAGAEFRYTDEVTGVRRDGAVWVLAHHLEGDFPGGSADLDYRFTLEGDLIRRVEIVLA